MGGDHSLCAEDARRLLGVGPGAEGAVLRRAYLTAVKASHPDRPGGDAARLRGVIAAYALLKAAPTNPPAGPTHTAPPADPLVISPLVALNGGCVSLGLGGGRRTQVTLPAGLRHGDQVRVDGRLLVVSVRAEAGLAVLGDHLCQTVEVDPGVLTHGGRLTVTTPAGDQVVWVSRASASRGFVRIAGLGLPARGDRARGHLFLRLRARVAAPAESASRDLRRRFAAAWAA